MALSNNQNKKTKKSHVLVLVIAIAVLFGIRQSDAATNAISSLASRFDGSRPVLAADESKQQDSLSEQSVNRERLHRRVTEKAAVTVDTTKMVAAINTVIDQNPDITFGISVVDLSTGSAYDYGNLEPMTAASVTKVLTAVYYLHQVEAGQRSLSAVMSNGQTAQQNIEQMIVVSNNDSWHILNDNLGPAALQDYAHGIGLASYYNPDNIITSSDTAKLFSQLYGDKLINKSNTELLLSYMERANYRDLIIPAVPANDTVYHKAGEYMANLNDAAIITNGQKSIVISIYTESKAGYDKSRVAHLMQQITTPTLEVFGLN